MDAIRYDLVLLAMCNDEFEGVTAFPRPLYEAISYLWSDGGIQATFSRKKEFQLVDSAK
jgi:hypothetical protein